MKCWLRQWERKLYTVETHFYILQRKNGKKCGWGNLFMNDFLKLWKNTDFVNVEMRFYHVVFKYILLFYLLIYLIDTPISANSDSKDQSSEKESMSFIFAECT